MKRLTKKIDNGRFVTTDAEARSYGETDPEDGFFYNYFTGEAVDKLAAYEDLEEQGRLIVLPCKVGDTVWFNTYKNNATECVGIQPHEVKRVNVCFLTDGAEIPEWEFGKTVFLTREEAEKALEGVSEDA